MLDSPTGGLPGYATGEIFTRLREYAKRTKVDLLSDNVVRAYRANDPERTTIYKPGETAEFLPFTVA